jgi:hypothetical protein
MTEDEQKPIKDPRDEVVAAARDVVDGMHNTPFKKYDAKRRLIKALDALSEGPPAEFEEEGE